MAKSTTPEAASGKFEQHPLALQLVPGTMPPEEFEAFKADIKKRGQQNEAITHEGKILDGWHRNLACQQLGITLKTKPYTGDDPAGFVIAMNVLRRKLGTTQRALAGAQLNLEHNLSQDAAALRVGVSKVHINLVVQAIRSKNARVLKLLENPDLTRAALHEELVDCGIVRTGGPTPAAAGIPAADPLSAALFGGTPTPAGDDDSEFEDLLGGDAADAALDDLLGEPPTAGGVVIDKKGKTVSPSEGGPVVGTRPTHPDRRNRETPASLLADKFKGLTAEDRVSFVQLAWHLIRPLLGTAGVQMDPPAAVAGAAIAKAQATAAAAPTAGKAGKGSKTAAGAAGKGGTTTGASKAA